MRTVEWIAFVSVFLISIRHIRTETGTIPTTFNGFTIEWQEFSLFQCSVPKTVDISLIDCFPSPKQLALLDYSCLSEFELVFDAEICVPTTTSSTTTTASITTTTVSTATTTASTTTTTASTTTTTVSTTTTTASTTTTTASTTTTTVSTTTTTASTTTTTASTTTTTASTSSTTTSTTTASTTTVASTTTTTPTSTVATQVTHNLLTTSSNNIISTAASIETSDGHRSTINPSTILTSQSVTSESSVVTSQTSTKANTANTAVTSMMITSEMSTVAATTPMLPIINYNSSSSDLVYRCPDGSLGLNCNIPSDPCTMSQPCLNDATCFPNQLLPLGYQCQCQERFSGDACEIDERACQEKTCWNNGTCIELNSTIFGSLNESNFFCECADGYEGRHCEKQIDQCVNITCENDGFCKTIDMVWKCICLDPSLFYGNFCEIQTSELKVFQAVSRSTVGVAIGAITLTLSFISVMDVLKYFFNIDPVKAERALKKSKMNAAKTLPNVAVRFQYVP